MAIEIERKNSTLVLAGASGSTAGGIGRIHTNTTAVGNVGAGEDNLMSYTLPANVLNADGKAVRITAMGQGANNANAKTVKLYLGGATGLTLVSAALTTGSIRDWYIQAIVVRSGAGTQRAFGYCMEGTSSAVIDVEGATGTRDETATQQILCTGTATADNDIQQFLLMVEVLN